MDLLSTWGLGALRVRIVRMSRSALGTVMVLVSSLAFGTLALFAHRSYEAGFGQITLLMVRFGVATALLAALAVWKRPKWPDKRQFKGLLLMGGFYVGQSFTFFAALKYIPASMVSLLLYLYPAIVTLGSIVFFHERMSMPKWLALGLAFGGSVLIVGVSTAGNAIGIAFGVGTALFYSSYLLLGYRVLNGIDAMASSLVVLGTAAVAYLVMALAQGLQWPTEPVGWIWAVLLAVVPTFIAISTLLAGLERVGPVVTSTLAAVEPLATATLSVMFLGERIGVAQAFGGICILSAVLILAKASAKAKLTQAVSSPTT